nr:Peptidoglycan-binding Lysin subgroup [Ipomoea batatas]
MAASIAATETQTEQCSKYCTAFRAFRPSRAAGDGESKRKLEVDESVRKIRSEVKSKVEAKMGKGGFSRASMFQIIASLFLIAVFALAETNPFGGPSCFTVVGVKEGDTCFDIAKSFNVSTKDFNAINPNLNCTALFIGQWLCIEGSVN